MSENERSSWLKVYILIFIVIIGLAILAILLGSGSGMMGGGMMGGGWLFMFLPIILIIFLIYALTDRDRDQHSQKPNYREENAMMVLERRYANGEISRGEYLRIKEDIRRI
jgi:putative membrane protein